VRRTEGRAGLPLRRADTTSGRRGEEDSRTSRGHHFRSRHGGRAWPVPLAIGATLGFAMGALAELFLLGQGWRTTFEEGVYPFSFVLAMAGVFLGGLLLLAAEREGNRPRAWRSVGVFVASSVLAALLFWGAM
jgi:hypothetical protein